VFEEYVVDPVKMFVTGYEAIGVPPIALPGRRTFLLVFAAMFTLPCRRFAGCPNLSARKMYLAKTLLSMGVDRSSVRATRAGYLNQSLRVKSVDTGIGSRVGYPEYAWIPLVGIEPLTKLPVARGA
jgi:hypothetical protein